MHEEAPKMSVTNTLVASTSELKNDISSDVADGFVMASTVPKNDVADELDLQVAFVDPSSGK